MPIQINKAGSPTTVKFSTPQEIIIDKDNDSITVFQPLHDELQANVNIQVGNVDVTRANAVPVIGGTGTLTNRSGTATTGSVEVIAANAARKYLFIQNVSNGEQWINFTASANTDQPSIRLTAGASFVMESNFISTEAVNIIKKSGGGEFTAKEG